MYSVLQKKTVVDNFSFEIYFKGVGSEAGGRVTQAWPINPVGK